MSSSRMIVVGLAVDLDFGAAVLADEDVVALLDGEGDASCRRRRVLPVPRATTFAFLGLFLGGVGNDDPALFDFFFFERLARARGRRWVGY